MEDVSRADLPRGAGDPKPHVVVLDKAVADHVAFHRKTMGRTDLPAPYLNGLESPADGKNIIRGLIARGYSDAEITKIAGGNALDFMRRVLR